MMPEQAYLIKYAEIALKGKNRKKFEQALICQIRSALDLIGAVYDITNPQGRIFIELKEDCDDDEVISSLTKVFGVNAVCPVILLEDNGFDELCDNVIRYFKENFGDSRLTFKVDARRARKNYPKNSMEINADLGEKILDAFPNTKVDVHNPDVLIHVEIRERINVYLKEYKGEGGMPLGTNGSAQLLLSGGIDSPVAGYMVARRGVTIHATYFHAPPYTSERAKQKVIDLAKILSKWLGSVKLHVVNFTDIQMCIYETCPHDELTIIMRRYMMKIAEHFAREDGDLGLVTGESIGQVASQTMASLACTNDVCTMPVYRPLIGFDKQDIIDIAERIGTYETSILPYEDCCVLFSPRHPVLRGTVEESHEIFKSLEIEELITKAVENREMKKFHVRNLVAKKYGTKINEEKLRTLLTQILSEWGHDD